MSGRRGGSHGRDDHEQGAPHAHDADAWEARVARYDALADQREPEMREATEALLDAVGARQGARLLDLACGPGHTTEAARLRGADVLGVDLTPGMIAAARRRFPHARFATGDMLDPPEGPWDAIVCRLGAHHVDPGWMRAAHRVLSPGGRIAIAEMAPTDEESVRNGMKPPAYWARAFEDAGFVDVHVGPRAFPRDVSVISGRKSPTRR